MKSIRITLLAALLVCAWRAMAFANAAPARLKKSVAIIPVVETKTLPDGYGAQPATALESALQRAGFSTRKAPAGAAEAKPQRKAGGRRSLRCD